MNRNPCFTFTYFRRQFEIQVQGKFKREPIGNIYVGIEAPQKMELSTFTRSISHAALQLGRTIVSDLHYSFGDDLSDPNHQIPHLVAPLFPALDRLIVTPPGGILPEINVPFVEDLNYRKQRMRFLHTSDAKIDLNNTYSFSAYNCNMNVLDWTLVGVPLVRPMDLRTFFGDTSIHIGMFGCVYEYVCIYAACCCHSYHSHCCCYCCYCYFLCYYQLLVDIYCNKHF